MASERLSGKRVRKGMKKEMVFSVTVDFVKRNGWNFVRRFVNLWFSS